MATLKHLNSGRIRVQFRKKGLKLISKTFDTLTEANNFVERLNADFNKIRDSESSTIPIDKLALFNALHPDLKPIAKLLPIFSSLIGDINGSEIILNHL